jgi:TIR domain
MTDARKPGFDGIRRDPQDVHVFISYSHDDFRIAKCLQDKLSAVNPARVRCFLDQYDIRSGDDWHSKIIANLEAADWLIFIYTGRERRSYDFCGYEIGIFTSAHRFDPSRKISEAARLLCLHDTATVPSMLSMVQNRRIRAYPSDGPRDSAEELQYYVDTPLAKFFEDFYYYPDSMPLHGGTMKKGLPLKQMPSVASEIGKSVQQLTFEFSESRLNDPVTTKFYQVRMEIEVREVLPSAATEIPGRSTVTAVQDTFNLIGLSPDPDENGEIKITWDAMKKKLIANNETCAWMDKIEDDLLDAVHQRNLRSPETTFRANDGQFYRPLLARQTIFGNGARNFSVIFVRTLPRKFVGDETTSALLIGLILASRFRFRFIEAGDELLQKTFGENVSDAEIQLGCRQLIYDIERMEQESSEFGMNSPDLLHEAFGSDKYEIVKAFYEIWFPARDGLFSTLARRIAAPNEISRDDIRQEVRKFATAIEPYNRLFLEMCVDKYTIFVKKWLKK